MHICLLATDPFRIPLGVLRILGMSRGHVRVELVACSVVRRNNDRDDFGVTREVRAPGGGYFAGGNWTWGQCFQ